MTLPVKNIILAVSLIKRVLEQRSDAPLEKYPRNLNEK